jgi:hypothetical protein
MDDFGMDNLCSYHQQNHSEKTCPQWVNSMTLVINQLLDQQEKMMNNQGSKKEETTEETTQESAMFLWDWCIDSDEEHIEEVFVGDTQVIKFPPEITTYATRVLFPTLLYPRKPSLLLEK